MATETLLLIPVDDSVVFPNMSVTLAIEVGDAQSVVLGPRKGDEFAGVGTVANVVVIAAVVDVALALLPAPDALVARIALLVGGVVLNGMATAAYVGRGSVRGHGTG